jgi:hypothetical protein
VIRAAAILVMLAASSAYAGAPGDTASAATAETKTEKEKDDDEIKPDRRAVRQAREANLEPERLREGLAIGIAIGPTMQIGFGERLAEASGTGGSFDIRIGTSATERLAWFLDFLIAGSPREGDTGKNKLNQTAGLIVGAQFFPLQALWVRAGLGIATATLRSETPEPMDPNNHTGLGVIVGGGIDFLRRGRFALSGQLTFMTGIYGGGAATAAVSAIGLTWY